MGFEEMGLTQTERDIAKIIEAQVGYETPIQWRIAKELALREETVLASQPVPQDTRTSAVLHRLFRQVEMLSSAIDKTPRFIPITRKKLVLMFNEAFELGEAPAAPKWWRFRTLSIDPVGERRVARVFGAALIWILFIILWAYVKS